MAAAIFSARDIADIGILFNGSLEIKYKGVIYSGLNLYTNAMTNTLTIECTDRQGIDKFIELPDGVDIPVMFYPQGGGSINVYINYNDDNGDIII